MSGYGRQIVLTSVIAVIIVLGIGLVAYYIGSSPQSSSPMVMILPQSGQSTNQTAGVKLEVSLNSTAIIDNPSLNTSDTILVSISEYNILSQVNNVTAASDWPIQNLSVGGCNFGEPFGIAVLKGYYTSTNISKGPSLPLFPALVCPAPELAGEYYIFQPESYSATIITIPYYSSLSPYTSTTAVHETLALQPVTDNVPLDGYCCRHIPVGNGAYAIGSIPFSAGSYTIVGGDGWGNLVIVHFTVTAGN